MNNVKLLHIKCCFFQFFNSPVALKNAYLAFENNIHRYEIIGPRTTTLIMVSGLGWIIGELLSNKLVRFIRFAIIILCCCSAT